MAILSNNASVGFLDAGVTSGYQIAKSLRLDGGDDAHLNKTFASGGSTTTWTLSFWIKGADIAQACYVFTGGTGTSSYITMDAGQFRFYSSAHDLKTNARYRDPSAWYHFVCVADTTNGTDNDKTRVYVNGTRLTVGDFATHTQPSASAALGDFGSAVAHYFNRLTSGSQEDMMLAEVHYIDGEALDASPFGETNADTGEWVPKKYKGDYNYAEKLNLKGTTNNEALDVVVNRVVDKCWIKSDGNWVGGGDPSDTSSAPTFHILNGEAAANLYWATTAYDEAHTITIGTSSETGTQPEWDDKSGSWTINSATEISGTFGGSYGHARTDAMTDGNVYAFTYTINAPTGGSSGANHSGWFITDSVISSYASTVPDEQSSINSVGSRWYAASGDGGYSMDHIAVYGDFVALNTTGSGGGYTFLGGLGTNSFYLKFDGTDIGEDSSGINNDWDANYLTAASTNINIPCVKFDGSGDYIEIPDHADFDFAGGEFTMECFVNPNTPASDTYHSLIGSGTGGTSASFWWSLHSKTDGTSAMVWYSFHGSATAESSMTTYVIPHNKWTHVAAVRDGDTLRLYINGVQNVTKDLSSYADMNNSTNTVRMGLDNDNLYDHNGAISNVRIIKGDCQYPSGTTFTVPSMPLAKITGTKLLCCQSSSTVNDDSSDTDHTITANGNAAAGTKSDDTTDDDVSNDTPTTFDDKSNGTGNYCTLNPLGSDGTLSQGNLTHEPGAGDYFATSTMGFTSGKWYGEFTLDTHAYPGIGVSYEAKPGAGWRATQAPYYFIYDNGSQLNNYPGGSEHFSSLPSTTFATGVWQIALDVDNGKCWIGFEDTWYSDQWATTGNPATGANPTFTLPSGKTWHFFLWSNGAKWTANFGQRLFSQTKPSEFLAPNTYNLPDPTIKDPSKQFDTVAWTATSTNPRTITTPGEWDPGLVWHKMRSATGSHYLWDKLRTFGDNGLIANSNAVEGDQSAYYTMADATNGFSIQQDGVGNEVNYNGSTYVSWMWKDGGSNTSVTAGSLNSSVYNTSADWSSTSTLTTPGGAFDGTDMGGSGNATYSSSGNTLTTSAITINSKLEIYTNRTHSGATDGTKVTINSTAYYDKALASTGWSEVDLSGATLPLTTSGAISIEDEGGSSSGLWGVRVDGKILVDDDVTPDSVPTIASTTRANTDAGFSIVTYTGNNTNPASVAHGLNAKPAMIWVKNRETASKNWVVYHKALGATKYLYLNTDAAEAASAGPWNNTEPTSTVWTMQDWSDMNNTDDFVAYLWSEVSGYSKFGTYEGNGNADGPFVWCGFRPAFVMIKKYNTTDNWLMWDDERSAYNPADVKLAANLTDEENSSSIGNTSYNMFDLVSNGFKIRSSASSANGSSDDFVFAAFADSPFKYANAR